MKWGCKCQIQSKTATLLLAPCWFCVHRCSSIFILFVPRSLGISFYKLGQLKKARYHWEKAIGLSKDNEMVPNILKKLKESEGN